MILIAFRADKKMLINPSQLLDWKQYQPFNHRMGQLTEYFAFPFGQAYSE
jgi:hypothetical protein